MFERLKAWRLRRQETVIAKATLLGMKAEYHEFTPHTWDTYRQRRWLGLPAVYLAYAPVHGGAGEVAAVGKTLYQCAKRWMKLQELT